MIVKRFEDQQCLEDARVNWWKEVLWISHLTLWNYKTLETHWKAAILKHKKLWLWTFKFTTFSHQRYLVFQRKWLWSNWRIVVLWLFLSWSNIWMCQTEDWYSSKPHILVKIGVSFFLSRSPNICYSKEVKLIENPLVLLLSEFRTIGPFCLFRYALMILHKFSSQAHGNKHQNKPLEIN